MTIAKVVTGAIGARGYLPEGPYGAAGQMPLPSWGPGDVIIGDLGAEFEFVLFPVTSAVTLNQGDCLIYDNSGYAVQSLTGTGAHPFGAMAGFVFFGGRIADLSGLVSPGNVWSYTFSTPGIYGLWVQRAGKSLINCATVNAQTKVLNTTAVAGQLNAPASALAGSLGFGTSQLYACPTSWTFTATNTAGSAVLTAVSWTKTPGIAKGQLITGTGIPTGAVVTDFNGNTVTMSQAATSSNSGITATVQNSVTTGTTTNGSTALTNVTSIAGMYPNQTITGTGIPASTTITSITGVAGGAYTINISQAATATASNITFTGSVYVEGFVCWPVVSVQN